MATMINFLSLFLTLLIALGMAFSYTPPSSHVRRRRTEEEYLTLEFSLWHPDFTAKDVTSSNNELFVDPIVEAIHSFVCDETGFALMVKEEDACKRIIAGQQQAMSVIEHDRSNLLVRDEEQGAIRWTTWTLTYPIAQADAIFLDQADITSDIMKEFQLALDIRIMEGAMDDKIQELGAFMSPIGQEIEIFQEIVSEQVNPEDSNPGLQLDHPKLLQSIGIIMVIGDVVGTLLLGYFGRRKVKQKKEAFKQTEGMGCLITEQGLSLILDVGRRKSTKAVSEEFETNPDSELFTFNHANPYTRSTGSSRRLEPGFERASSSSSNEQNCGKGPSYGGMPPSQASSLLARLAFETDDEPLGIGFF